MLNLESRCMSSMRNLESRCMSTMLNLESRCMSSMLNVVAVNPHSTTDSCQCLLVNST